jgi:hypothetical protein
VPGISRGSIKGEIFESEGTIEQRFGVLIVGGEGAVGRSQGGENREWVVVTLCRHEVRGG